uniref:Integrase core domain containing protein n=1 Tax=Solanum tuberosum TaxID=4113 RepID=M1DR32_SOLTU
MLSHLANWVELAEPLGVSPNVPILPLNFMLYVLMGSVTFGKKLKVAKDIRRLAESVFVSLSIPLDLYMTKSKVVERITPAQEKSKGIVIKEDAFTSKGKTSKLPTTTGKGKGKRPTSARKTITLDPSIPSWARGFCSAVHVFLENTHSTDLGESGTAVPLEVTSGTDAQAQSEALGNDAQAQDEASGTDAQTDGAIA